MMKRFGIPLLLVTLLGFLSCMVPVPPQQASGRFPVAGETTLVFRTVGQARTFADQWSAATYLALELKNLVDGSTKFVTATKDGNGDFIVAVGGLVAGDWRLRAYFYDSEAAGNLLLYARQTEYLAPGQVRNDIVLALYQPGSLDGADPDAGADAHHLGIDPDGASHGAADAPRSLEAGNRLKLQATVYSATETGVPDEYELAADQGVIWTASDPQVVTVSASGLVTALEPGLAFVTAASVENPAAVQRYYFKVVPGIEGSWLVPATNPYATNELFRFGQGRWVYFQWDGQESMVTRGTYSLNGTHVDMVTEGLLLPGAVEWIPWDSGYDFDQYLSFEYAVVDAQLLLYQKKVFGDGPKIAIDTDGGPGGIGYTLEFTATRVAEDPLTSDEVTFNSLAPDQTGSIAADHGEVLDFSTTLADATINKLVWVSDNPSTMLFWDGGYVEIAAVYEGSATLRGYALGTLDYEGTLASSGVQPVVTLNLTVGAPPP